MQARIQLYHKELQARDGMRLSYLCIEPPEPRVVLMFLHGAAMDSEPYIPFVTALGRLGVSVYLLNLRGHGASSGPRGEVSYIGQYEDDVQDLIVHIRKKVKDLPLFLGAHSMGSSVMVRTLARYGTDAISGIVFVAPVFLGHLELLRDPPTLYKSSFVFRYLRRLRLHHAAA